MATHDYIISNASGAAVRADLNNALAAIVSNNSNASSPSTTYAYQWWADTTTGQLKLRNSANNAWITIFELDGTMLMEDGTVSAPGLAFASDLNTGFFRSAADKINFATGGVERLEIGSSEVVFNDGSNDVDFRVESNGNTHMLFVDGGNDRVGIGTSAPEEILHIAAASETVNSRDGVMLESTSALAADTGLPLVFSADIGGGFTNYGIASIAGRKENATSTNAAGYLQFGTGSSGGAISEAARIDSSGNLFIGGTTASSADIALNANGSATFEGSVSSGPKKAYNDDLRGCFIDSYGFINVNSLSGSADAQNLIVLQRGQASGGAAGDGVKFQVKNDGSASFSGVVTGSRFINATGSADPWLKGVNSSGTETFNVNKAGAAYFASNVGIGTSPSTELHVAASSGYSELRLAGASGSGASVEFYESTTKRGDIYIDPSENIVFRNNTERMRLDPSGRLLVGNTSNVATASGFNPSVQVAGTGAAAAISVGRYVNSTSPGQIVIQKSRGGVGVQTIVQSGDYLGEITFEGSNGSAFKQGAIVSAQVDGTPGSGDDMPGRLVFSTSSDGSSTPTERMRIKSNGQFFINTGGGAPNASTSGIEFGGNGYIYNVVDSGTVQYLDRMGNDGIIVEFRQANQAEGSISVSGSTVSYNGGHLSRWSQLAGGIERTEILRGSVLSNLDEMCEWGEEDNEQLNRMKVSDVEGDKNVSGVFQAWDDDDDTYVNDFYCAMTGDFVIRIAQGTTVARGDLLMSAGDGTAKPQDDDIVRSKTIAKVTSTTVSTTYSDNSYCVPCVLMAC